jgi:long-chain acyl-CoA synthetase
MAFLVHELLAETASRRSSHTALIAGEETRSFADLDRDSDAVARALQDLGLERGDRVVVMLENGVDFAVAFLAVLKAGGVHVPLSPTVRAEKLALIVADTGARVVIASEPVAGTVQSAIAGRPVTVVWGGKALAAMAARGGRPRDPRLIDLDLATLPFTSGTTGRPKGVMLTHANLVSTTKAIAGYLGNTPDDVVLGVLPLTFGYGLSQLLTSILTGFTLVLERSFAFPADVLRRIAERRVTGLPAVPAIFATLLDQPGFEGAALPSLRYLTNAADALPPAHIARIASRFPRADLFSMYGATECSTRIAYLPPGRIADKPHSVGRAIPNCEVFLLDESGARVGTGEIGELAVRGSNVMRGYWQDEAATARALVAGVVPDERVYRTGDLFSADAEGFLSFVGRVDDVFKSRGEKVSPREVEAVLCELDGVAEACAVGVPHETDGMAIKVFIVPRQGAAPDAAQVMRHCRSRLEGHLVPRFVEFCAALPKTESGKTRRRALSAV